MTFVLTFVASSAKHPLKDSHIKNAVKIAGMYNVQSKSKHTWLAKGKAADLDVSGEGGSSMLMQLREMLAPDKIDLFITHHTNRRKKLLLADMDSTIVAGETLDDMAEFAGIKDQIAAITARAMNGELDFHTALKERVGLLKGLSTEALQKTLSHTVMNPGAQTFVATMQKHGATCVLVSGGFTFFTGAIAGQVGFDHHHGNTLGITGGINGEQLSGEVIPPILDKFAKVEFLEHYTKTLGIGFEEALTIGDGANDLPMLKKAGLGIGYHAKPNVASELKNLIIHGDLSAALYAQGYKSSDFA
jgi:phosphoserine phosphatase